jgi:Rho GTPase-activating protein 1
MRIVRMDIFIFDSVFCDFCSAKFGRKVMYINYLHELNQHIRLDQLSIPQPVLE